MRGNLALAMILVGFVTYAAHIGAIQRLLYVVGLAESPGT